MKIVCEEPLDRKTDPLTFVSMHLENLPRVGGRGQSQGRFIPPEVLYKIHGADL